MNLKKLIVAGAMVIAPQSLTNTTTSVVHAQLKKVLENVETKDNTPVYYNFSVSQELLHQIDTMCLDLECPIVFSRSREDLRNTPLVMKWTRRHIWEYLWYDQYDYILKTYNNDTIPDSFKTPDDLRIEKFEHIKFPLIYDEIGKVVPHTLSWLLQEEKFAAYRDSIHAQDTLMINMDINGKRSFLYYETGKLILATHTTIGRGKSTPRGLFRVDYRVDYKRSRRYNNAAMPYALHVTDNIFVHQGKVSPSVNSHGCNRLPWLYAEVLYYLTTIPKLDMVYKAEKNILDSVQRQIYDSLRRATPKMLIVD